MTFKLTTGMTFSISRLYVLFFPCAVQKATAHVRTKALDMHHQAQKSSCGIFIGITQHEKGYLVYVPHKRKIVSLYDIVFDESLSSVFSYTSQPDVEAMDM